MGATIVAAFGASPRRGRQERFPYIFKRCHRQRGVAQNKARAGMLRFILTIISLALLIIAFARPRIGMGYSEREESGIDIVLAVDTSGSMAALDFTSDADAPITRLDAVKR